MLLPEALRAAALAALARWLRPPSSMARVPLARSSVGHHPHRSRGPPACSEPAVSGPVRSALAAWMPKCGCSMACTLVPIYRRRWPPPLSTQASRRGPALRWIHLALPRLSAPPLAAWLHPPRLHPRASLPRARRAALAALLAQAAPAPAAEPARWRAAKGANAVRGLGVARCSTCAGYVARLGVQARVGQITVRKTTGTCDYRYRTRTGRTPPPDRSAD